MDLFSHSSKDIGVLGEKAAAEYLRRRGYTILGMNIRFTFGELDIVAVRKDCLHIVEVKSLRCTDFPDADADSYDPAQNLHRNKLAKVMRTGAWYVSRIEWEEELQIDAALVWLRERDGMARVRYVPQIL